MSTLKTEFYNILATDAQSSSAGSLGMLLNMKSTEPYGIYFRNPPKEIDFSSYSIITYFINSMAGDFPRDIYFNVTAWGNNFEAILNRCYDLLHDTRIENVTDYKFLKCEFNNAGAELQSELFDVYFQVNRYLIRGVKE